MNHSLPPSSSQSHRRAMVHDAKQPIDYEAKDRRRKQLHSQIEKRRRERMAVCYEKLKALVPGMSPGESLQKLQILEATVLYLEGLAKKEKHCDYISESTLNCLIETSSMTSSTPSLDGLLSIPKNPKMSITALVE
ncbi:hypothetical protein HDU91_000204 [Kappamyces sp. JEL0680]|nr:hypothetical protein HDU91_000204 [Kappamyces sp. JEL0680]